MGTNKQSNLWQHYQIWQHWQPTDIELNPGPLTLVEKTLSLSQMCKAQPAKTDTQAPVQKLLILKRRFSLFLIMAVLNLN